MTENNIPTALEAAVQPVVEKPSRLRTLTANHPKITRAVKLTAAGSGLVLVTRLVTNAQHNKEKLAEGLDHAKEATESLSDAVTITDES